MFAQKSLCALVSVFSAGLLCSTCAAVPAAWNAPPRSAAGDQLLAQVRTAIRRMENAVHVITIQAHARYYGETYAPASKRSVWQSKPVEIAHLTASYGGLPWGKFRADVRKDHAIWSGGPHPVAADRYMVAYNGRFGTYLETYAGWPKHQQPFNHGKVTAHMPKIRSSIDAFSGWDLSIYGFTAVLSPQYRVRFTAYIKPNQQWAWVAAKKVMRHGRQYVQVTRVGDPQGKEVFLLDPRHGYSIARETLYGWRAMKSSTGHIFVVPGTQAKGYFVATGFTEPAPGIFFPGHIVINTFDPGIKAFRRKAVINIQKVTANRPGFREGRYVIRFPRGAIVTDEATGERVRIGGTPQQQMHQIERQLQRGAFAPAPGRPSTTNAPN